MFLFSIHFTLNNNIYNLTKLFFDVFIKVFNMLKTFIKKKRESCDLKIEEFEHAVVDMLICTLSGRSSILSIEDENIIRRRAQRS